MNTGTKITSDAQALAVLRNGEWPIDQVCEAAAALDYLAARLASTSPAPDGWVLVPRELTSAMSDALWNSANSTLQVKAWYAAMMAAAPQPVVEKDNG